MNDTLFLTEVVRETKMKPVSIRDLEGQKPWKSLRTEHPPIGQSVWIVSEHGTLIPARLLSISHIEGGIQYEWFTPKYNLKIFLSESDTNSPRNAAWRDDIRLPAGF